MKAITLLLIFTLFATSYAIAEGLNTKDICRQIGQVQRDRRNGTAFVKRWFRNDDSIRIREANEALCANAWKKYKNAWISKDVPPKEKAKFFGSCPWFIFELPLDEACAVVEADPGAAFWIDAELDNHLDGKMRQARIVTDKIVKKLPDIDISLKPDRLHDPKYMRDSADRFRSHQRAR